MQGGWSWAVSASCCQTHLLSELGLLEDDVGRDKEEAGESPQQHKGHPEGVAERGPMLVDIKTQVESISYRNRLLDELVLQCNSAKNKGWICWLPSFVLV